MPSKPTGNLARSLALRTHRKSHGFALVVTLSLLMLLTLVGVGMLTLSSISLRAANQGDAMQTARANARLAMMLALGDLQKQLGPDTRISTTADQIPGTSPDDPKVPAAQRHWAGAYNSWPAADPAAQRPNPEFLQWFVSGSPEKVARQDFAESAVGGTSVEIVTAKSAGSADRAVRVPVVTQQLTKGVKQNYAWWVSDLGTKALVSASRETPATLAETRADSQSAPSVNLRDASSGTAKPFAQLAMTSPDLAKVSSWQSAELIADQPANLSGLFHDLTTHSRGLLTNVRAGGFRKDLSMELERPATSQPNSTNTALYKAGGETGINLQELWVYYNSYTKVRRSGSAPFTTGGTMPSGTPHLIHESSPAACQNDDWFHMKQPVVISYQLVLSLKTLPTSVNGQTVNRLQIVADPVVTLWNPLDMPVVVPAGSFFTAKFWQIPYDLVINRNGTGDRVYPLAACLSNASNTADGDSNFLSLQFGKLQQLAFKPGEVIKFSQVGNTIAKSSVPDIHKLGGNKGFNYGGGVSMPVRDRAGATVDLGANDTVRYQFRPNGFTAGATTRSGRTVESDGTSHTRHFSLTHHEFYFGEDRGNASISLGIGNMAIDWDFGNRRLRPTENRGTTDPGIAGTKNPAERIYANNSKFAGIFRNIAGSDTRDLPASALIASKQPVMLVSYNAKTERGTKQGTRFLSRFNPKALHVDFYDLSLAERDMLPYEYSVEPLLSWKNNKLELSSNGSGYFGGGMDATDGSSFVTTHSIPREPIVSLAAFQHSFANGFDIQKPKYGYATLNAREPMMPQIGHAIGNSLACPVLPSTRTQGSLPGGRPMADHSYLANQALWDDWFLSGITPQTVGGYAKSRNQKTVANEFFSGATKLPVVRFLPNLRGQNPTQVVNNLIPGSTPSPNATLQMASLMQVDGMFNVNSTSVEAWKCLLGALKERPSVVRDATGKESIKPAGADTLVAGLLAPMDVIARGDGNVDVQEPEQWVGRRTLSDDEIDSLARAIVREVRKRGPFLSLADFVNRRVGTDAELARSGAIQSALDSDDVPINRAYLSNGRAVSNTTSSRFAFPEAEEGPLAHGSAGVVKQADILTPIAPVLSARSDSFLIRGYGEQTDSSGKVLARAWCEAVVERSAEFVDPVDAANKTYSTISSTNKTFGRRFLITSFRWLDAKDA